MAKVYHKHMTQRVASDPHWAVNCMAYAAAMAINDTVLGGLYDVTGQNVRRYSSEPNPDPSSPGLNVAQVCRVAVDHYRVGMADRTGQSWGTLMTALNRGTRIILAVDYAKLGGARCQANGDFKHAMCLVRDSGTNTILASDPLCSAAKNYSENALHAAATAVTGTTLYWAMTRPIPRIA